MRQFFLFKGCKKVRRSNGLPLTLPSKRTGQDAQAPKNLVGQYQPNKSSFDLLG